MRKERKTNAGKERFAMITSSVFVLAALTMTGIYIKNQNADTKDDGYTIDFTALRDDGTEENTNLAKNDITLPPIINGAENIGEKINEQPVTEDDLDYAPVEVDSGQVEIPGLTDSQSKNPIEEEQSLKTLAEKMYDMAIEERTKAEQLRNEIASQYGEGAQSEEAEIMDDGILNQSEEILSGPVYQEFSFSEETGLVRPVPGDILMHYSMDSSIYFATLDQYKYNPAVIFQANEGIQVSSCGAGRVVAIYDNPQLGQVVTIDMGNGYQATYGQLRDLAVVQDSYVEAGTILGFINKPTKYYSVEGSNLYFKLTKDGEAVNPEPLFR